MGVKIKVFKMVPENSEVISEFMESVKVIEQGVLISDGSVGILYKNRDEVGMKTTELVTTISGELAKSQAQFAKSEGLVRAYGALITKFEGDIKQEQDLADASQKELDAHMQTYDDRLETLVKEGQKEVDELTAKHQRTPKKDQETREMILKLWNDKNKALQDNKAAFEAYKKGFDEKASEISKRMGEHAVNAANLQGKVKENQGYLDDAVVARDHARVFIVTSKQLIADLEAGAVDGVL